MTMTAERKYWTDHHASHLGFGPLSIFIRKLLRRGLLSTNDQQSIAELSVRVQRFDPEAQLLREGDHALVCPILLEGFAYRYKVAADGGRQIVALKVPGDALDFQSIHLRQSDHDLRCLTRATIAFVPLKEFEILSDQRPAIARAIQVDTLIEGSIAREWLLNNGRRNAEERLAHFLCELYYRIGEIEEPPPLGFEVPLTQEQLADLLGLTPVHINRMLKLLERRGALDRNGARRPRIGDISRLREISHFSEVYLHQDNLGAG